MVASILIGIIVASCVFILDQGSKLLMIYLLADKPNNTITLIDNFLDLKLVFNTGASFSLFAGKFWLLMTITVIATLLFIYFARYADFRKAKTYSLGIYFMIGGMLGNFIDRAFAIDRSSLFTALNAPAHGVTDFIAFDFFPAVFNIADSFLTVGVVLVLIDIIFLERKRRKNDGFTSE